jgi:hypothetical protein
MSRLEVELASLPELTPADMRARWAEIDQRPPPAVPPWLLRALLASRLQERRHGTLPVLVQRELSRLTSSELEGGGSLGRRQKLSAGARLVREWNGRTIVVEVMDGSYRHADRTWRSLSEIARHVTGAHWSGPRFFGLAPHG